MADKDKNAVGWLIRHFSGQNILQARSLNRILPQDVCNHRVPDKVDLRVRKSTVLQDRSSAERIPPVNNRHRFCIAREEEPFFQGAVATTDHDHVLLAKEPAVTGGAPRNAFPRKFLFTRYFQPVGTGAGGND